MGKSKKTVKVEEQENETETVDEAKQENVASDENANADDNKSIIRILSHGSSPKLSARGVGNLEYEVGIDDETDDFYIRIAGNASSGAYSTKWVNLNEIRAILDGVEEETFKAVVLRDLYVGQSSCNAGFAAAILRTLGVLISVDKTSALQAGNWDCLIEKINQLKNDGVSLTDHIAIAAAERAKKKQAAAGKRKIVKKKPTSKS